MCRLQYGAHAAQNNSGTLRVRAGREDAHETEHDDRRAEIHDAVPHGDVSMFASMTRKIKMTVSTPVTTAAKTARSPVMAAVSA